MRLKIYSFAVKKKCLGRYEELVKTHVWNDENGLVGWKCVLDLRFVKGALNFFSEILNT